MQEKKPRKTNVILEVPEPQVITQEMEARDEAVIVDRVESRLETSYDRAKGPKVIHQIPLRGGSPSGADPNRVLLTFDLLLACDATGIQEVAGFPVSVASVVEAVRRVDGDTLTAELRPVAAYEFRGIDGEPEKVSWVHVLKILEHSSSLPKSVGLVVDAHLGELNDYNARRKALLDDYLLPGWATLIYASADTGMDYLGNRLLRHCDQEASRILSDIVRGREARLDGLHPADHPRYTHVRHWIVGRGKRAGAYWFKR